ncbi:GNAT family N-acetyltransferase [Nocardioides sp.]|jgi:GNAT superfamily N-acetyltransferase|uniref:GNAT family N-acetyltransferase n=1 Tax=Nocardioides sp. TaxID=35761 RepID=UPI002F3E3E90
MAVISTRVANDRDLELLRDLYRRSSLSNAGDRANLLASSEALHWTGAGIAGGRTRVATDEGGRILGFATVVSIDGGLELEDLFVDPDAMRQGVATRLMLEAVTQAAREGEPWIEVTANPHAAEFYASAGFVRVAEEQTLFGPAPRLRRDVASPD